MCCLSASDTTIAEQVLVGFYTVLGMATQKTQSYSLAALINTFILTVDLMTMGNYSAITCSNKATEGLSPDCRASSSLE